jgi:hypothetical protein
MSTAIVPIVTNRDTIYVLKFSSKQPIPILSFISINAMRGLVLKEKKELESAKTL